MLLPRYSRRALVILGIMLDILPGCKKSASNALPASYISCDIGGKPHYYEYKFVPTHDLDSSGTNTTLFILSAYADSTDSTTYFALAVICGQAIGPAPCNPIVAGNYSNSDPDYRVIGQLSDSSGIYTSATIPNYGSGSSPFEITIKQISAQSVSGTFDGELFLGNTLTEVTVTNGEFRAVFK